MVIKVINLHKCIKKFGDISGIDVMPVIKEGTREVQRTARDIVPVDTGTLKRSIHTQMYPKQNAGIVYTTTEYASYVEFGTSRMRAQPYMTPAMNAHRKEIKQNMVSFLKTKLREKTRG